MNNPETIQAIINLLFVIIIIGIIALVVVGIMSIIYFKKKNTSQKDNSNHENEKISTSETISTNTSNKQPIFNFMEFDKIEDNMIIQKNGKRFLMIVQCQGINFDLMSGQEKVAVESGFIQFLNTIRHPIQLYIQTRTVNLEESITNYKSRVDEIETQLRKKEREYQNKLNSGLYSQEDIDKEYYELTKKRNLYEYGKDIIYNTQMMSLNKNVLNKQYYVVIPYYSEEVGNENYDKEEVKNVAFSELYTRAQSIIRTLATCEVSGKILSSNDLVDLLYVAYNRDESEVFGLDKAIQAGYDELYSTAQDVLDKRIRELDKEVERRAMEKANEAVYQAKTEKQRKIEEKEISIDYLSDELARVLLNKNKQYVGISTTKRALEIIDEDAQERGGVENVVQQE